MSIKAFRVLPALLLLACNMKDGSDIAEEPSPQPYVRYEEWEAQTVKIVNLGLTNCALSVRGGPAQQVEGTQTTCEKAELGRAGELVSDQAWQSYVGLTYEELHGGAAGSVGTSGAGGQGDAAPVGSGVDGSASVRTEAGTKVFWVTSTGPERELIAFFRTLHDKYRRF